MSDIVATRLSLKTRKRHTQIEQLVRHFLFLTGREQF